MPPSFQTFLVFPYSLPVNRTVCSSCLRSFQRQWAYHRTVSTASKILNSEDPKLKDFTPKPLSRPIGVVNPPKPGENSGIDPRSWRERRDDLFDYNKHLVRRKELTKQVVKPYFRDWSRANYHKGKSFVAPARLFRAEKSLYFPNMVGSTLASPSTPSNTTSVLQNRISVVSVYSGHWAELQTQTFTGAEKNPALDGFFVTERERKERVPLLQKVEINIEEDWMKALVVRTFMGRIRRQREQEDWQRYFLVRRGVTEEMREAMVMVNSKVGYTYLVDWKCRIRWGGSADAEEGENEALAAGVKSLIEAWRREKVEGVKGVVKGGAVKIGG